MRFANDSSNASTLRQQGWIKEENPDKND